MLFSASTLAIYTTFRIFRLKSDSKTVEILHVAVQHDSASRTVQLTLMSVLDYPLFSCCSFYLQITLMLYRCALGFITGDKYNTLCRMKKAGLSSLTMKRTTFSFFLFIKGYSKSWLSTSVFFSHPNPVLTKPELRAAWLWVPLG